MSSDLLEKATNEFRAGQVDFERGEYRSAVQHLDKARTFVERNSRLEGEISIWLVTAYDAAGQHSEALALCRLLTNHAHLETRKESKRLLYILEAPKLQSKPEWLTQIPDLTNIDESAGSAKKFTNSSGIKSSSISGSKNQTEELIEVEQEDNRFIWLALGLVILVIVGLFYFSLT